MALAIFKPAQAHSFLAALERQIKHLYKPITYAFVQFLDSTGEILEHIFLDCSLVMLEST